MLPELPDDLYRHPGPFASVYIDVSRDHQDSPHEIELRWKELSRSLAEQGADDADIRAIEDALSEPTGQSGPAGRALVATGGQVRLDAALPDRPRREIARWAPLPHVMPLLAQASDPLVYVVVDLGRTSATVRVVGATGTIWESTGHGQDDKAHKVRGGGPAHRNMQSHTEEVWAKNVRAFARMIDDAVARAHPQLLVVTGDVRARAMLLDTLGERSRSLAEDVDGPSPGDATTPDGGVDRRVEDLVAARAAERTRQALDGVNRAFGRDTGLATSGLGPVITTLQQAQVETLVIVDDPSSALELWVGPEPAQLAESEEGLRTIGAEMLGRDRADAALVRAAAGTGAAVLVLPHPDAAKDPNRAGSAAGARGAGPGADEGPELTDGVGAVLRFSTPEA